MGYTQHCKLRDISGARFYSLLKFKGAPEVRDRHFRRNSSSQPACGASIARATVYYLVKAPEGASVLADG